ncbi:MAG: hypothetical protein GX078_07775 [Clostridiales bacterium]|nr:hypothetical protein [Clostridiales bacterium]
MYYEKKYKLMGLFFGAMCLYIIVYMFQLGISSTRLFGAVICALLSIGSFRRSK